MGTYERLVAEAAEAPIRGFDFSWLEGRATEERPSWHYSEMAAERMTRVSSALDLETGGGEVLARMAGLAPETVATESWGPNVAVARERLEPFGVRVIETGAEPVLPLPAGAFDLVIYRHGTMGRALSDDADHWWAEVSRVLRPGGSFLSQQVGAATMTALREAMGESTAGSPFRWGPEMARTALERAGLEILDLREEFPKTVFFDIGAIVYYLRLVIWIVSDFSVERYRDELLRLHHHIESEGPFIAHAHRFLVQARKPKSANPG
jgi:SAM-dependent methyltransferase